MWLNSNRVVILIIRYKSSDPTQPNSFNQLMNTWLFCYHLCWYLYAWSSQSIGTSLSASNFISYFGLTGSIFCGNHVFKFNEFKDEISCLKQETFVHWANATCLCLVDSHNKIILHFSLETLNMFSFMWALYHK